MNSFLKAFTNLVVFHIWLINITVKDQDQRKIKKSYKLKMMSKNFKKHCT